MILNKMKRKKCKSYISLKQRITAAFMVAVMLLQICVPTVALATTAWGTQAEFNRQLQLQLESGLFSRVENTAADEAYKGAFYIYQEPQPTTNLLDFYRDYNEVSDSPVIKMVGDTFVQTRLIRSQIKALLGRFLIPKSIAPLTVYAAEAEQINKLYEAGIGYGGPKNNRIPMGTPLAANAAVATDMIWPEVRTIATSNGDVTVLVPVVHLSQATMESKVDGHDINLFGDTEFAGLTLSEDVLLTGGNNTITGVNGIINNGGNIQALGNITLSSSGTIANLGGVFSATGNLKIVADNFYNKTLVVPYKDKNGEGTKIGRVAQITGSSIEVVAADGITFEGASAISTEGTLTLSAENDINILPVQTGSSGQSQSGHWEINKSTTDLLMSRLVAEDTLSLIAGGVINITASELISTRGGIELLAKNGIHILDELEQTTIQKEDRKGKTTGTSSEFRTEAVRAILKAGKGVLLDSDFGDVTLRATEITSAEGAQVNAQNGKVHLLMTKELEEFHLQTVRKGTWTIKTRTEDVIHENNIQNAIVGGLQVQARYGINVEYTGKEGASLKEQLEEYAKMPEMAWMAEIYNSCLIERDDPTAGTDLIEDVVDGAVDLGSTLNTCDDEGVSWKAVQEVHEEIRKSKSTLSPAAMAIIAIAVCIAMGPAGAGLIGSGGTGIIGGLAGNATLGAALNAGALTLATQAAQSLAAGNNLRETLNAMDSNESLKSLAISMVTAGALQNSNIDMFSEAAASQDLLVSLSGQAAQAIVNATVSAGVSVAINGGNSDAYLTAFKQTLVTNAINTIGQKLANNIATADSLDKAAQYISNAALGCLTENLTAKLSEQDAKDACLSGAGGAVIAVGLADILEQKTKNLITTTVSEGQVSQSSAELSATLSFLNDNRVDISRLFAGLVVFAAHGDVNAASNGAGVIGAAQEQRIMRTVGVGRTILAMGMAGCGEASLSECGKQAAINEFRKGLIEQGKYSVQEIDAKINYLKTQTSFFDDMGAYNAAVIETEGSLEELTQVSKDYPDPNVPPPAPGQLKTVVVTTDEWSVMQKSLYGVGETIGLAANTADALVQDGVKALLETPYGAPLRWGLAKVAETAKKYPEIASLLNKPEELKEALGTGVASVLIGDKYAETKLFLGSDPSVSPDFDIEWHDSVSNASSGFSWVIGTLGAGALGYAAKAMTFTRTTSDGRNFSNDDEDFYKTEKDLEFTNVSRLQLANFLSKNKIPLKAGWDADRLYDEVLTKPKGQRPPPSDYLPAEYIAAHLSKFEGGASRIMIKDVLDDFGPSREDGTSFIAPRAQIDKALAEANGDRVKLASSLGLPDNYFVGKVMVRVDIPDPKNAGLRVPSGNEAGANRDWLTGGKLPFGADEAVVDLNKSHEGITWNKVILDF